MNRTDQAPEPTMEEILASIRLIISDDAKKGPPERDEHLRRLAPSGAEPASLSALPEEDVLDLTDALLPEEHPASGAPPSSLSSRPEKAAALSQTPPAESQPRGEQDAAAAASETSAETLQQPELPQPPAGPREEPSRPAPSESRPVWSRRDFPGSPAPVAGPVPRYEAAPAARQPQRNWAKDIQMPIPERGPVSLIPGQTQAQGQELRGEAEASEEVEAESETALSNGLGEKEEAAVAALAESLARSAAGAMHSDELTTAGGVDFSRLGDEQKAEVTETFAHAIQRESGSRDKNPLPTLLDEVFRQDFIRDSAADEEPAEDSGEPADSASAREDEDKSNERAFPHWGAPEIALQSPESRQPAPWARNESRSRRTETFVQNAPTVAAASREAEPARPAPSGLSLEDTVRDMLRPLMMQWLNDHMPRILENAIREEIATRGLLPKTEK